MEGNKSKIERLSKNLSYQFRKKWLAVKRTKRAFLEKYKNWLNNSVTFLCVEKKIVSRPKIVGRPKGDFSKLTYTAKYKRTETLRDDHDTEELLFAAQMNLRAEGKSATAKRLSHLSDVPVKQNYPKIVHQLTNERALALIVDARLSKNQYQQLRNTAKENNADLYPSYNKVREAKKLCYPEKITASENSVCVELQSLLDHTTCRLLSALDLKNLKINSLELVLVWKWGMDGSSGQKEYKQAFHGNFSDSNLLLTCLVPLELSTTNRKNERVVIWSNPTPSSTRYCRPCKMQFLKETIEVSKTEYAQMEAEIAALSPTFFDNQPEPLKIIHQLHMTMIDTKMINSITDCSSQKCYLCGASPVEMNDIEKLLHKPIKTENLKFGITSLHIWIRSFECFLKISYRLPLEKWQARGEDKIIVKGQKSKIQAEFRSRLGIIVDQPKQGAGTSNDGNCARKFFQNFTISAEITGIDVNLIYRFYIILQVIASGFLIKKDEFNTYTIETAHLFVSLYPWYRMPTSIHKILLHGSAIIESSPVPIGQLSEEAQEARNKEYRRFREHNSRKCNRTLTNIDIFNNLLVSSDPKITSLRNKPILRKKQFCPEALNLLEPNTVNGSLDFNSSSESESE